MTPGKAHVEEEILTNVRKKNKIKMKRYALYTLSTRLMT
jgi:hypothetical protein